jgi:hypothetical protein
MTRDLAIQIIKESSETIDGIYHTKYVDENFVIYLINKIFNEVENKNNG